MTRCGSLLPYAYLGETGDRSILDEPVPFDNDQQGTAADGAPAPQLQLYRAPTRARTGCR